MHSIEVEIPTGSRETVRNITEVCVEFLREIEANDGLLHVFVPHSTAGLALVETGAGSDADLLTALRDILPADDRWQHRHGSAGHGRDHVLPAFLSPSTVLPVVNGNLELGTWQSICLVDTNTDNPRRALRLSFVVG